MKRLNWINKVLYHLKWLYLCTEGFRLKIILVTALSAADSLTSVWFVWVFKNLVDIATGVKEGAVLEQVIWIAGILILQQILGLANNFAFTWLQQNFNNSLKERTYAVILELDWMEYARNHSGSLLTRLNSDTASVMELMTSNLPGILVSMIHLLAIFGIMVFLDPVIAIISITAIPLFYLLYVILGKKLKQSQHAYLNSVADNNSFIQESIQNAIVIKAFQLAGTFRNRLKELQTANYRLARKKMLYGAAAGTVINVGFTASYISAFLLSAFRMQAGIITFGTLSAFLQLVNQLQSPIFSLSSNLSRMLSAYVAAERILELNAYKKEAQGDRPRRISRPGIVFREVSFHYKDEEPVLNHVSIRIQPGTATAVIGKTGAGKTTLVRILLGLVSPSEGGVYLFQGEEMEMITPAVRCNISYVPQGNSLFSGTIRENILLGNPAADEEQYRKAVYASCSEFIEDLSEREDTEIGEKNTGLSEGQAQRIAIARTLVRDAGILIFDEATSALDERTQQTVFGRIRECYEGKTMLFITHKLSLAASCDQVLKVGQHEVKWLDPMMVSELDLKD